MNKMKIKFRVGHKTYLFDTAKAGSLSVILTLNVGGITEQLYPKNLSGLTNDGLMSSSVIRTSFSTRSYLV